MKFLPQLASCALVLGTAALAHAEPKTVASIEPLYPPAKASRAPAPPRAAPPAHEDLGPAPDNPAPVHYRHGFYLRLAAGGGYLSDSETASDGSGDRLYGAGQTYDIFLGGSIVPGLALGAGIVAGKVSKPTVELDGQTVQSNGSLSYGILSGFVDWYPTPSGGLHVLALGGYAGFGVNDESGNSVGPNAHGPAFGLGAGYEWSIGTRFGLGVMARYIYAPLRMSTSGGSATESISSPQLMLTGTLY